MGVTHTEFTISPEGYVRDILTTKSTSGHFTRASVDAIKKFLYKPPVSGNAIYSKRTVFIYQLGEQFDVKIETKKLMDDLNKLEQSASKEDPVAQYRYASRLNTFRYFRKYLNNLDIDLQHKTANEWFTKSAKNGLPHAQYEIGRNMLEGRGCKTDQANGYKWINAAAINGYSPAQKKLAQSPLVEGIASVEKSKAAIGWLKNAAQSNDYSAKLLLAWKLSTANEQELRNGKKALEYLKEKPKNYFDKVRIIETKAAAYAELGNFRKAKSLQKKAKKIAEKLKWDIPLISKRLASYKQNKPYRGTYY